MRGRKVASVDRIDYDDLFPFPPAARAEPIGSRTGRSKDRQPASRDRAERDKRTERTYTPYELQDAGVTEAGRVRRSTLCGASWV